VRAFFSRRAPRYDRIADTPFWDFSDRLLWELVQRALPRPRGSSRGAGFRFLDAGGGTGRWSVRLLEAFPGSTGVLLDVSPAMLGETRRKAERRGVADRLALVRHDLHDPFPFPRGSEPFDVVLCLHNVAGLVADPGLLLRRLVRATRPGGLLVLVVPNLHQAAWVSLRDGRPAELRRLLSRGCVRYGPGVPEVLCFTPDYLRSLLVRAGCGEVAVHGFPVSVYPVDPAGTDPGLFGSPRAVRRLVALEAPFCLDEGAAARGNNLLALARRG
jgi:SAM-dependent methyltransferase